MVFSSEFDFNMSDNKENDELLAIFLAQSQSQTNEKQQREAVNYCKGRTEENVDYSIVIIRLIRKR